MSRIRVVDTSVFLLSLLTAVSTELVGLRIFGRLSVPPLVNLGLLRLLQLVLLLLVVRLWGPGFRGIGLGSSQILPGLKKGALWSLVFALCAALGFIVLQVLGIKPLSLTQTPLPDAVEDRILFFVVGGLVAPITEEVFFRGIVYGFLRRWGAPLAISGSAIVFVLAHAFGSGVPLTQIVGGIVFAVAYELSGKLMVPITIHALGNTAIFTLSLIVLLLGALS